MQAFKLFSFCLIFCFFFSQISTDIPVHCLYEDYAGTWQYLLGKGGHGNTVNCSLPFEITEVYEVSLLYPDVSMDLKQNKGFWTRIYDEGVELVIRNQKFFAFSKFVEQNGVSTSYCNETFPGWYHNVDGSNWGCFTAIKVQDGTSKHVPKQLMTQINVVTSPDNTWKQESKIIEEQNKNGKTWTARSYPNLFSASRKDIFRKLGGAIANHQKPLPKTPFSKLPKYKTPVDQLPVNFDWRNKDGSNFVSPVRDQGSCGSCYAFATTAMLEARIRVQSNNQQTTILSPQEIVSCSQYAQGCEGGFDYLISKYGEDFGLVEEACYPYQDYSGRYVPCTPCNGRRIKVTNYYYIGGYYGASTEQLMMQEIYENGPISVSIEVYPDFSLYSSGVYIHNATLSSLSNNLPWEITNHVVCVVGWGFDEQSSLPYWIVKNSWGNTWGLDGYIWIRKGTDEIAIESMSVAATPVLN
eukprot:TRINITY_DN389_c0_g1_i1.p1 TRINITY_DN389_c0_g1~~TRINITY_DN389_c0_g1_i1.p1  ORF type:complete len:487 (-),score=209.22 TRINITY_DN389_c0_g1_i1:1326-2729(-)